MPIPAHSSPPAPPHTSSALQFCASQYEHVSRLVAGVGKLLGGWLRQTRQALGRSADDV